MKLPALAWAALLAAAQVQAGGLPRHGLVVFSSECVSEQSDDLYGMRVTLRRIGRVDDLVLERADFAPEVIWPLRLDSAAGRLSFESHAGAGPAQTVDGRLSRDGMRLELRGLPDAPPEYRETLKRVTDFSRDLPKCGAR